MNRKLLPSIVPGLAALALALPSSAEAGCNCRKNAAPAAMVPVPMAPMMAAPVMPAPVVAQPVARPAIPPRVWITAAPPGTLGRTYKLCSRPLREDEHPRNAGLEIRVSEAVQEIEVEKMEDGYVDSEGMWHFLTEKPLLPGRPPIVRVVMTRHHEGRMVQDVRVVRLIPGRILTVDF